MLGCVMPKLEGSHILGLVTAVWLREEFRKHPTCFLSHCALRATRPPLHLVSWAVLPSPPFRLRCQRPSSQPPAPPLFVSSPLHGLNSNPTPEGQGSPPREQVGTLITENVCLSSFHGTRSLFTSCEQSHQQLMKTKKQTH